MFTHLILLKSSPYFIYCISEEEAILEASSLDHSEVVGVVCSKGLVVNTVKTKLVLETLEPKKITKMVKIDEDTFAEVPETREDPLSDELKEILNREEN